jgi:hypothetical protein
MIDVHKHVIIEDATPEKLMAHMDILGVEKAWLLTWEAIDGGTYEGFVRVSSGAVWSAHRRWPGRFIPFCGIDPRIENAPERVRRFAEQGFKGYGESKIRLCIDSPWLQEIYRVCGDLEMPVLIHIDVPLTGPEWYNPDIDGLFRMASIFPRTTFVGHGPGFWREISGDADGDRAPYPEGPIKPHGKLPELLKEHSNVYADISAGSGLNALSRDPGFADGFIKDYAHKLLYGTDEQTSKHLELLQGKGLPEAKFHMITEGNASRVIH